MLNIMTKEEMKYSKELTKEDFRNIREELTKKGLELYDIKLEFGRIGEDNILPNR